MDNKCIILGASFAEALGMATPSKTKKKSTPIKDAFSPNSSNITDVSFYLEMLILKLFYIFRPCPFTFYFETLIQ